MTGTSAGRRYLRAAVELTARLETGAWPAIDAGAALMASALASGADDPRLRHRPLAHARGGAVLPGRRPGARAAHPVRGADAPRQRARSARPSSGCPGSPRPSSTTIPWPRATCCVVASNSGGNAVVTEMARLARDARRAPSSPSRAWRTRRPRRPAHTAGRALHEIADVVIDNGGASGDAAIDIDGLRPPGRPHLHGRRRRHRSTRSSPRPSSASCARGVAPEVFTSSQRRRRRRRERQVGRPARTTRERPTSARSPVRRPRRHRGLLRPPLDARAAARPRRLPRRPGA